MQLDVTQPLRSFDGRPITEPVDDTPDAAQRPVVLRSLMCNALVATLPGETVIGDEKFRRFLLAQRIATQDVVPFKVEELALVKRLIGIAYGTLLVGAAWLLLDPPAEPPKDATP